MNNSNPTFQISNTKDLSGLLNEFKKIIFKELEKTIPVEVISYDNTKNRVNVKCLLYDEIADNKKIEKMPFLDIPVFIYGAGDFFITFPIKSGDKGWLISNDKDISNFKQNLTLSAPNTYLKHRYTDAFFLPDLINKNVDINYLTIGSNTTNLKIKENEININSKKTNIVSNETNISDKLNIDGETTINNILNVNNIINASSLNISGSGSATGSLSAGVLSAGNGATGTFISKDDKVITVRNGIIININ